MRKRTEFEGGKKVNWDYLTRQVNTVLWFISLQFKQAVALDMIHLENLIWKAEPRDVI